MKTIASKLLSANTCVTAHFTTRHGGVSMAPFNFSNLAFHVGDNPVSVVQNHQLLAQKIGYNLTDLIHMRQIHSDRVLIADETMNFKTPPECDALISNRFDVPLMVMSADCTPILIFDPIHNAIGAIHAGRAGALNAILPKTLSSMHRHYGTSADDVQIILGPSIHGCCYEINEAIALEVKSQGYGEALRREENQVFLDVNTILLLQLKESGVSAERIEVIDECTACNSGDYFSYRADTQHTGRIAGVILLRSSLS
ncbi:MAG TPA: peptidoglycan editing factor PgeF [Sulfuricurvum sp.]|nr:peptidoglycan editing factor PgeF [Sulfuricurvum sp.]